MGVFRSSIKPVGTVVKVRVGNGLGAAPVGNLEGDGKTNPPNCARLSAFSSEPRSAEPIPKSNFHIVLPVIAN